MRPPISLLIKLTFQTIRRDPLVLAPYLIFFVLAELSTHWIAMPTSFNVSTWSTQTMGVFVLQWVVELFFKLTTVALAYSIFSYSLSTKSDQKIRLKPVFSRVFSRFIPTIFWSSVVLGPIFLAAAFWAPVLIKQGYSEQMVFLVLGILVIPIGLIAEFLPTVLICDEGKMRFSLAATARFVWKNLGSIMIFMAVSVTTLMVSVILGSIFSLAPGGAGGLFSTLAQGLGYGIVYTLNPILFTLLKFDSSHLD